MHKKQFIIVAILILLVSYSISAQKKNFPIVTKKSRVSIIYDDKADKLISIVANLLAEDIERVTDFKPPVGTDISKASGNVIIIGNSQSEIIKKTLNVKSSKVKLLENKWESFAIQVIDAPSNNISKAYVITGSDTRGTAYGVFSLSEKIGVSPWYWWADAPVRKQKELSVLQDDYVSSPPAVKYRGIFINDEDWGLQPWAAKKFEPETGDIGPKTYVKVFELLLRLKANMVWPAMHPSTKAFFSYPGNVKAADDYQIIIGSSHAEPMLRNNVGEWDEKKMGHFNYITNKSKVFDYWEERIKESRNLNSIYTIGMRGVHDSQMEGVNNLNDAGALLEAIFKDQRQLLSKYVNSDMTKVPQAFTVYKEVLDIYDNGLKVPEDVTIVWPDDNYGYIQRLNNEKEEIRPGGSGVYYHASYWGRPHDYLWLPSIHPALMREEMMKAFETGADRIWVLNVGDIKPLEYNIQEFLDMAYNPLPFKDSRYCQKHLKNWISTIFGSKQSQEIFSILWTYYQLAFERKPEFMGWSQVEPSTNTTYTAYNHFFYGDEAQKRIDKFNELQRAAQKLKSGLDPNYADVYYELVYYPVVGASLLNKKFLYRDKAYYYLLQNRLSAFDYNRNIKLVYDSIVKETNYYNTQLANGKWENIMSMEPRNLAVFQIPSVPSQGNQNESSWGISPEGYSITDSAHLQNSNTFLVPAFDNLNDQKYFIDVFLCKDQILKWSATSSENWIRVSKTKGELSSGEGKNQIRIWLSIDWSKIVQKGKVVGQVIFSDGSKEIQVKVEANKKYQPVKGYKGFVENNGVVSMLASHFTTLVNKGSTGWNIISGLGYKDSSIQALPFILQPKFSISLDSVKKNNSFVEYDFVSFSAVTPSIIIYSLPTHPLNNNFNVRYAINIDDGPLQIIDTRTQGRSEEWKQNVLRNRAERKISLPFLISGKHSLRIYAIDPGVILDQVVIDLGGMRQAYSAIEETKVK